MHFSNIATGPGRNLTTQKVLVMPQDWIFV
jgi:hypothetical protein